MVNHTVVAENPISHGAHESARWHLVNTVQLTQPLWHFDARARFVQRQRTHGERTNKIISKIATRRLRSSLFRHEFHSRCAPYSRAVTVKRIRLLLHFAFLSPSVSLSRELIVQLCANLCSAHCGYNNRWMLAPIVLRLTPHARAYFLLTRTHKHIHTVPHTRSTSVHIVDAIDGDITARQVAVVCIAPCLLLHMFHSYIVWFGRISCDWICFRKEVYNCVLVIDSSAV